MPRLVTSPEEHSIRFNEWKGYIENMSDFERPYSIVSNMSDKELDSKNKYTRFMSYTREWLYAILKANRGGATLSLRPSEYDYLETYDAELKKGWFKKIMNVKSGDDLGFKFPRASGEHGDICTYDAFMPAYRALKESFEKRSVWQWFTNHSQYTAERDAIKAIEGTMMALTGGSKEDINAAYNEYCQQFPSYEPEAIKEMTKEFDARPKIKVPVSESMTTKFRDIERYSSFERNLRRNIRDALKDVDSDAYNLSRRLLDMTSDSTIHHICDEIDKATPMGPEYEENAAKRATKSLFNTTCRILVHGNVSTKESFLKAQKITDIMLQSCLPSLFKDGKYAYLANNYIVSSKENLKDMINSYSSFYSRIEDKDSLVKELYNEFHNIKEPDVAPKTEPAPQTEAVVEKNEVKARLDLSAEFGEKANVEKSPEIKETDAPVVDTAKVN